MSLMVLVLQCQTLYALAKQIVDAGGPSYVAFSLAKLYIPSNINTDRVATTISCPLVYNQNHYFGLGTIPRPKPKLADTFSRYRNRYKNHILKGQSSYVQIATGIFSIIKGPQTLDTFRLFLKIWVYFQAYKSLYPPKKREKMRKL